MKDLKRYKVLVTPTSFGKDNPKLRADLESQVGKVIYNETGKPLSSDEVATFLPGVDGYIAGLDVIDREALKAADRLKVISRYGVGYDRVDLEAAHEKGIIVTNTPGANAVSVAELTVGLMLSLARQIPEAVLSTRQGKWPRFSGVSLRGKTIGILGLGAIGKCVAARLKEFDCRIIAFDPSVDLKFATDLGVEVSSMNEVISQSDFLTLHLPLLPETRGLVNADFLNKMKKGSYFLNTARGELVVEADLIKAIQSNHLAGAALDVFDQEPPSTENPLLQMSNVLVTPHSGAHSDDATNAMGKMAMEDCLAVLRGLNPLYRVI
jgi:D-3-phosphoglycerate dehydrogenase